MAEPFRGATTVPNRKDPDGACFDRTPKPPPRTGSLENPEVIENVPGHVIPILEREFDDFDTESTRFLKGELEEDDFIKFRLKQGVYGQRQPDVQMVRVKLPMGGVTPDQLDAFADVIEKYVPLRKGHITTRQNIQMHHVPLPDAAELIRELGDAGLSSREGCGNTMRNVTGDPRAGTLRRRAVRHHPVRRRLRPLLRPPPDDAGDAAQGQDGVHGDRRGQRDHRRSTTWPSLPRERDGVRGVEVRVGGGTSIMPRIAPTLYEFVELDNGDYLKVTEAVHADLRPPGLPARQPRPRSDQGADRQDRHRRLPRAWSRRSSRATGSPSATSRLDEILFDHDEEAQRPRGRRAATPRPTATAASSTASWSQTSSAQRQDGLLARSRSRSAAAT